MSVEFVVGTVVGIVIAIVAGVIVRAAWIDWKAWNGRIADRFEKLFDSDYKQDRSIQTHENRLVDLRKDLDAIREHLDTLAKAHNTHSHQGIDEARKAISTLLERVGNLEVEHKQHRDDSNEIDEALADHKAMLTGHEDRLGELEVSRDQHRQTLDNLMADR